MNEGESFRRIKLVSFVAISDLACRGVNVGRCVCGGGGVTPLDICFSRSPSECSRSQNLNCLNRCDFYSRTTKCFRLNRTR